MRLCSTRRCARLMAREQVKAALREAEVARTHVDVKLSALNAAHAEQLAAANTEAARWRECAENADKKAASIFIPGGVREGLSGNGSSRAAGGTPLLRRAGSGLVVGIGEDEDEEGMEKGLREGTEDGLRRSAVNRDGGEDGWIVRAPPRAREGRRPRPPRPFAKNQRRIRGCGTVVILGIS